VSPSFFGIGHLVKNYAVVKNYAGSGAVCYPEQMHRLEFVFLDLESQYRLEFVFLDLESQWRKGKNHSAHGPLLYGNLQGAMLYSQHESVLYYKGSFLPRLTFSHLFVHPDHFA